MDQCRDLIYRALTFLHQFCDVGVEMMELASKWAKPKGKVHQCWDSQDIGSGTGAPGSNMSVISLREHHG